MKAHKRPKETEKIHKPFKKSYFNSHPVKTDGKCYCPKREKEDIVENLHTYCGGSI